MKIFFFNRRSMVWIVILIVAIVIAIILLAGNTAQPTGILQDYILKYYNP